MAQANTSRTSEEQFENDRQRRGITGARSGSLKIVYSEPDEDGGLIVKVKNTDPSDDSKDETMYRTVVSPQRVCVGCYCPDKSWNLPTVDDKGNHVSKCKHQHAVDKLLSEIRMYVRDDSMDVQDAVARVPGNDVAIKVAYNFLDGAFDR